MRLFIHDYAGHPFQAQLSRELSRRGHSVVHAFAGELLTPRGSLHKKRDDPDTLEFIQVSMDANYRRDKYRFLRRRRMELAYGSQVASLIESVKPDVVLSANTPTEPQMRIARTCSVGGISFIPWIQDFYSIAVAKLAKKQLPVIGNLIGWWYGYLEKRILAQAAAVVAITDDFAPMLRKLGVPGEKIVVIPNWAPLDELPQKSRRNGWSATQGLDDKFVFLYSGTLAMKHNPDILRQLALLFRDDREVRILVISEGPGADYLRERKTTEMLDNLEILPFQDFDKMPDILASADVLVAVLEADAGIFSVPSKVLTYLCAGKALLGAIPSSNLSARIISTEKSGICVEPDDINGILQAAKKLRSDQKMTEQLGAAARAYAENHFEIKKIGDRFEQVCGKSVAVQAPR